MPRGGGKKSHKGKHRQFTSPEELEAQRKKDLEKRKQESSSSEEESDEEDSRNIIEVNNPNRIQQKNKKISDLSAVPEAAAAPLSRRQREEIAKQEAARRYEQLHREGKTEEARADLARLAIVRKQREEAAKKREEEKKAKEDAQARLKAQSLNAIKPSGKRGKS
ncbi:28 kDa heat- and acid-stable phosphoprotein-like [Styela clava]|uniref:28 kDa heat- and acid-stable phosphoprotein-like n=1 Tax=Styela clava TaxID=7725 RepID=UPI00193A521B|nr:28 kDa heat- and acid-stable phosphoprotein-like [Styela clava]